MSADLVIAVPLKHEVIDHMDALYGLSASRNVEVSFRYLIICLKSKYTKVFPAASQFLSRHGRGMCVCVCVCMIVILACTHKRTHMCTFWSSKKDMRVHMHMHTDPCVLINIAKN